MKAFSECRKVVTLAGIVGQVPEGLRLLRKVCVGAREGGEALAEADVGGVPVLLVERRAAGQRAGAEPRRRPGRGRRGGRGGRRGAAPRVAAAGAAAPPAPPQRRRRPHARVRARRRSGPRHPGRLLSPWLARGSRASSRRRRTKSDLNFHPKQPHFYFLYASDIPVGLCKAIFSKSIVTSNMITLTQNIFRIYSFRAYFSFGLFSFVDMGIPYSIFRDMYGYYLSK